MRLPADLQLERAHTKTQEQLLLLAPAVEELLLTRSIRSPAVACYVYAQPTAHPSYDNRMLHVANAADNSTVVVVVVPRSDVFHVMVCLELPRPVLDHHLAPFRSVPPLHNQPTNPSNYLSEPPSLSLLRLKTLHLPSSHVVDTLSNE